MPTYPGERNPKWRGGGTVRPDGRPMAYAPGHPRADGRCYVLSYILQAEAAIGHYLPERAVVHHLDGDPTNNANNNLVICEDQAYHVYLHKRLRAFRACGHADWRRCPHCDTWKPRDQFSKAINARCVACVPTPEQKREIERNRRAILAEKARTRWAKWKAGGAE